MDQSKSHSESIASPKILIVDDRIENLVALEKALEDLDAEIVKATSGEEALACLLEHAIALILLDVQMPEMDGLETARLIQGNRDTRHIPIIFVTAISKDPEHIFSGYASGAVDYLFKPLDTVILKSKVRIFLELDRQKTMIAQTNAQLKAANRRIIEQQKALIKEARLKVLLQMAGATAHELNQPLMGLFGNIDLLRLARNDTAQLTQRLDNIEAAAQRMADIIKRIQTIGSDETKPYPGGSSIINIDQAVELLFLGSSDSGFGLLNTLLQDQRNIHLARAKSIAEGLEVLKKAPVNIVVVEDPLADGNILEFLKEIASAGIKKPVLVFTDPNDKRAVTQWVRYGVYDLLPKTGLKKALLVHSITTALEKFRLQFT